MLELMEDDWEPAKAFFEERKVTKADMGGAGDWDGWSHELDGVWDGPSSLFALLTKA